MQEETQTISDFIRRTDALADRKGLIMSEIHGLLGISKAMVFSYRAGKNRITPKVWLKLEAAERAAGMIPPAGQIAESSAKPKFPGIGDSACVVREDPAIYGKKPPEPETMEERMERMEREMGRMASALEAFGKIREGLDLIENLIKYPPKGK